jgi:aldose 1-epimerase
MREIGSPAGVQWEIVDAGHRAVIVEIGGGLRSYEVDGVPIVDAYDAEEMSPGSAGQILAPWPNRIRDGSYTFANTAHQLPLSEPTNHNAIHGLTRWLRWDAVETTASSVAVECVIAPQPGYPWPVRVRTTWSVSADGLRVDHVATNEGAAACPWGIGAHPYLILPGVPVDDIVLTVPAASILLTDSRLLPIGAAKVASGAFDFTEPRRIGDARLDTAFGDVVRDDSGVSRVTLTHGDRSREVWADASYGWWQVFTGDTLHGERVRRSVAVEPMTCPPDAFRSHRDVVTIEPDASWRGSWGIRGVR